MTRRPKTAWEFLRPATSRPAVAGAGGRRATWVALITRRVIIESVLRSFRDKETEAIWHRQRSRRLDGPAQRVAWRKLAMLDAAETLADLRIPPGNRLEKLTGNRAGQHSIRINQQWRICFTWSDAGPEHVEIVDCH
jgi:toxin HigB-1